MRAFEDFTPGLVLELGSRTVTAEEIVRFGREFDPQPFHVDEEAARDSAFGGLVASGWHSGAMFMRLLVDAILADSTSMGASGIDELRWHRAVRPGDVLTGRMTVLEATPSERSPDRGFVRARFELETEDAVAMSGIARMYFRRRA